MPANLRHSRLLRTSTLMLLTVVLGPPFGGGDAAHAVDGLDDGPGAAGHVLFDLGGDMTDQAFACAAQADGKLVLAGRASDDDGEDSKIAVARLGAAGGLDPTFGVGGRVTIDFSTLGYGLDSGVARAVVVDEDGGLLVAGISRQIADGATVVFVTRLLPNGTIDPTYAFNGIAGGWYFSTYLPAVSTAAIDGSGYLWIVGPKLADLTGGWAFLRIDATGFEYAAVTIPDEVAPISMPTSILFQPDSKPVIGGWGQSAPPESYASMYLIRLLAGGPTAVPDPSFGFWSNGWLRLDYSGNTYLQSLALLPDRKIVVAGQSGPFAAEDLLVQRLTPNGVSDGSEERYVAFDVGGFGGDGVGGQVRMVAQSDGKVVLAARALTGDAGNFSDIGVARLRTDLELDPSFGGNGTGKRVFGMASPPPGAGDEGIGCLLLAGGRPVIVGWSEYIGLDTDFAYRRLANDLIFADGFESGWSFFWSDSAPQ